MNKNWVLGLVGLVVVFDAVMVALTNGAIMSIVATILAAVAFVLIWLTPEAIHE